MEYARKNVITIPPGYTQPLNPCSADVATLILLILKQRFRKWAMWTPRVTFGLYGYHESEKKVIHEIKMGSTKLKWARRDSNRVLEVKIGINNIKMNLTRLKSGPQHKNRVIREKWGPRE